MKIIQNNQKLMCLVVKCVPLFFVVTIIDNIFLGILNSYATVLFVKILIDQLTAGIYFFDILSLIGKLFFFYLFGYIIHVWYLHILKPKSSYMLHEKIQSMLFKQASAIDLSCYDNPSYYDNFIWSMKEADRQALSLIEDIGTFCNRVISVSTIIIILSTIDALISIFIAISIIVSLIIKLMRTKAAYNRDQNLYPVQRQEEYIDRIYYLQDYAKDIRSTDVSQILDREFDRYIKNKHVLLKKHGFHLTIINFIYDLSSSVIFNIGILLLLIYKIQIERKISPGDFAATVGSCWKLFWQINSLIDIVSGMLKRSLYADRFFKFIDNKSSMAEQSCKKVLKKPNGILSLRNISFRYPGHDDYVLQNISFDIHPGEKIAFVGYNGAGKTTLMRLIMRLYDPTEGDIYLDGVNIREIPVRDYRANIGTVFQNYQTYAVSVAENVLADLYSTELQKNVWSALGKSGLYEQIRLSANGIETNVSKEFDSDGLQLSGGERQKLAIARIFSKNCNVVILDEPSASLDAKSEYELNERMFRASLEKTVIFTSHRLTATTIADRIIVLENGRIIEEGSHLQLMRKSGKYAEMYRLQAEKYKI